MAVPPTITLGAANGASSITSAGNTGAATSAGVTDTMLSARLKPISGTFGANNTAAYYPGTHVSTQGGINSGARPYSTGQIGMGVGFFCDDPVFDFCMYANASARIRVAVTDMATGVRQWATAADITPTPGTSYTRFDFGSRANRLIELYMGSASALPIGFCFAKTAQVKPAVFPYQPTMAVLGDSWVAGTNNDNIRSITAYVCAETLGIRNPILNGAGGTGFLNVNSVNTFGQRIAAGDLAVSLIGSIDLILVVGSVNDATSVSAAYTDAAYQAAVTSAIAALMIAQPTAIIMVAGPQFTKNFQTTVSRYAACKAGVAAAANGDPRVIFIDSSPAGDAWQTGTGYAGVGTVTFSANPTANDTVTLGGSAVTFVMTGATGNQVTIGANLAATLANFVTFANASLDSNIRKATYVASATAFTVTSGTAGFTLAASAATVSSASLTGPVGDGSNDFYGATDGTHMNAAGNYNDGRNEAMSVIKNLELLAV